MKVDTGKFLKYIVFVVVLAWLLLSYPLFKFADAVFIKSFITGFLISFVNSVVGFLIIKHAMLKSDKEFLKLTLGSMSIRLFAIAGVVIVLLKFLNFEIYGLMLSLLLFYFIFLSVEIFVLGKLVTKGEITGGVGK